MRVCTVGVLQGAHAGSVHEQKLLGAAPHKVSMKPPVHCDNFLLNTIQVARLVQHWMQVQSETCALWLLQFAEKEDLAPAALPPGTDNSAGGRGPPWLLGCDPTEPSNLRSCTCMCITVLQTDLGHQFH